MSTPTGMKQRCWEHDYCSPSFYMVTVVTEPRRNCLSQLRPGPGTESGNRGCPRHRTQTRADPAGSVSGAAPAGSVSGAAPAGSVSGAAPAPVSLQLSPAGEVVRDVWRRTSRIYPKVEACECVVMPDHFHGILWVKERLERPMGHIVKAFKRVSAQECRSKGLLPGSATAPAGSGSGAAPAPTPSALWDEGFQDTILVHRGQLKAMVNYIADNPRRLAVKQANPDLFTVARDLAVAPGWTCPGIGNLFLLDRPVKRQVQVSRSISSEALAEKKAELLAAAEHGAVLVSPCISPGEKEITHAALDAGLPLVVVLTNGIPQNYKPPGRYFDACARGCLLMLAPLPHHRDRRAITREECLKLNEWAATVANPGSRG